jgi:hypothetical protein
MTRNRTLTRTVALATTALSLVLAGPAAADSIVYEKGPNIWIANPDGSGQHQVTLNGTDARRYGDPSQADDGTIVASHGNDIVRLRQNGEVLSRFDPPGTTDSAGQPIDGVPQDLSVSPDGSKVAFSYYQYGCPPGAACGARTVLLYSSATAATPVSQYGKLFRRNASWISNGRILAFGGYLSQVNVDSPGGGDDDDQHWFDDQDLNTPSTDLGDGELSRQGDRLAILRSYGEGLHLAFYSVSGDLQSGAPPAPPAVACHSGTDASLDSPTWSPDGRTIAYAVSGGVETLSLPNVEPGYCNGAGSSTLVLPGAAEPDFGPAAVRPGAKPAASCKRLRGGARTRCARRVALAKCRTAGSRRKRKLCVRRVNRRYRKAARPAAASARFQTGRFRVELEGVQRTTWETHHVKQFACDVNIDGHGTETVRFRSRPAVLTVGSFGDSTPVLLIGRKPAILDLRSRITRNGVLDSSGGEVCSYGDGTGGAPPPPDCGTKRSTLFAELTYDSQRPGVIGLDQALVTPLGPFRNCPSGGTSWPALFDHHVDTSRMIGQRLPARELFHHGKHIVIARGREQQNTAGDRSTTTIRWTLSLTRIPTTGRKNP